MKNALIAFSLIVITLVICGCTNKQNTTINIVRHAEKELTGDDPNLTAQGRARALALRDQHANTAIAAVYSTDTKRTRQTAAPLAEAKGLPLTIYTTSSEVAENVLANHMGSYVVIVGHSNTVGDIVQSLGADLPDGFIHPMDEKDYDNSLFVLITGEESAQATHSTYGESSP